MTISSSTKRIIYIALCVSLGQSVIADSRVKAENDKAMSKVPVYSPTVTIDSHTALSTAAEEVHSKPCSAVNIPGLLFSSAAFVSRFQAG